MVLDLKIRVLFCYSPEVLQSTYRNFRQLATDNSNLCSITTGIFGQNLNRGVYKVNVFHVASVEIAKLQKQYGIPKSCLTLAQVDRLTNGLATNATMYGNLRQQLLLLKNYYRATIVVLQVKLCRQVPNGARIIGVSGKVGITNSSEAFVAIARSPVVANKTTTATFCWVLAHEFGHLMGCRHPYGVTRSGFDNAATGNNHGHCFINSTTNKIECGTLMSYAEHPVMYYSNPNLFAYPHPHENDACGEVGKSETYLTVNANIQKLAGIF